MGAIAREIPPPQARPSHGPRGTLELTVTLALVGTSEAILDECFRSILRSRPDLVQDSLERTRSLF